MLHSKSTIVADVPGFVRESVEHADADLSAEQAGRLCYLSGHRPNKKMAVNGAYLLNICAQKHYSVLGHASASFYIETSRNITHEIIRHRWFTFSEVSQRYVDAAKLGYEVHPGLPNEPEISQELDKQAARSKALYYDLVTDMVEAEYGHKSARQAARGVLPGNTHTKILMSGNLRAWRDFLAQRLSPAADLEIQGVAREIYKIMKVEFPNSFQDFDSYGMITTERLIKRALARLDKALETGVKSGSTPWPSLVRKEFEDEVRNIIEQGLWVLKDDPWVEGDY